MIFKNIKIKAFIIGAILFTTYSCKHDYIVLPPTSSDKEVSFNNDIIPIFESKCVACHGSGATPDLTSANAYNSIVNLNLVDTLNPENSIIYKHPLSSSHGGGVVYSEPAANLVLTWIKQGAKNN